MLHTTDRKKHHFNEHFADLVWEKVSNKKCIRKDATFYINMHANKLRSRL